MNKELEALKLDLEEFKLSKTTEFILLRFDREEALNMLKALTPPTKEEIIEALKKDTKIDTWYYDEDLKVFWSSKENECEEVGEKYQTAYMENETRLMICKFYEGEIK